MERPIKGGYILISLALIPLVAEATLQIDYDRITRTKKHIVLTGIKVADTVMPDLVVKPIFGNGKITFSDVYGYDIVVSSNNNAVVSEHESEEVPNVEEAPSGTIVDALGLDEDGKVVKGVMPETVKLYQHDLVDGDYNEFIVLSLNPTPISATGTSLLTALSKCFICSRSDSGFLKYTGSDSAIPLTLNDGTTITFNSTSYTDTVTEL